MSDLYNDAHLFVAAIRIFNHLNNRPPSVDEVRKMLSFSSEKGSLVCFQIQKQGIIERVEGGFGDRLFIKDHMKIETLKGSEKGKRFDQELEKFKQSRNDFENKIGSSREKMEQKRKDLFAEIEKKLKNEIKR